jgi:hypothetical protein
MQTKLDSLMQSGWTLLLALAAAGVGMAHPA